MASIPDQEPEQDPFTSKDDPGKKEPILAEAIPATHGGLGKPWLLQDWIALTVAFSLSKLFIGSAWITWRDWPVVMRQIAEGNAKLHKTEKIVRDPQELKRHMQEQLQRVDEKIAGHSRQLEQETAISLSARRFLWSCFTCLWSGL